ncbi:MAG: putative transcriptional regulator [Neolewinella sp.]|jgi:predicted transcriptional regulator
MALSKSEEQLMKYLWQTDGYFMKDLLAALPEPKPAKTTVATLLKRMIDKKMVRYETFGNSRKYFPTVSKKAYFGNHLRGMIDNFFDASPTAFASLFAEETDMTREQLEELQRMIDDKLKK